MEVWDGIQDILAVDPMLAGYAALSYLLVWASTQTSRGVTATVEMCR